MSRPPLLRDAFVVLEGRLFRLFFIWTLVFLSAYTFWWSECFLTFIVEVVIHVRFQQLVAKKAVVCSISPPPHHPYSSSTGVVPCTAVTGVSAQHRVRMFEACLPWMAGTHVMGRLIAQLVCHSVLPECVATAADAAGAAAAAALASGAGHQAPGADSQIGIGPQHTHLEALFLFLRDNPEMVGQGWKRR